MAAAVLLLVAVLAVDGSSASSGAPRAGEPVVGGSGADVGTRPGRQAQSGAGAPTVTATASCARAGSRDAGGNPTSYTPDRAVDGDLTTAWRCDGTGEGQSLTLTLDRAVPLRRLGVVPGLAKTDPFDGKDRYAQNRRIARVRVDVPGAGTTEATFDTAPGNRSVQEVDLPGTTTDTVTLTIVSSVVGSPQGDQPAYESVAISEVTVG